MAALVAMGLSDGEVAWRTPLPDGVSWVWGLGDRLVAATDDDSEFLLLN